MFIFLKNDRKIMNDELSSSAPRDKGLHFLDRPIGLVIIVLYKFIWGTSEILFGSLALLSPAIIRGELAEDPQDIFANWLLSHVHYNYQIFINIGLIAMAFGLVKLILAVSLWYRSWFMRKSLIIFFIIIVIFGIYYLSIKFSFFTVAGLVIDGLILYYLWKILPKHLGDRGLF
jgi:uncharacterized membrane protein